MKQVALQPIVWIIGTALLCWVSPICPAVNQGTGLQVGYGEVDITPPMGVTMPGYFRTRHANGILDPLLAKVLVLKQNQTTLAIIALDLIGIEAPVVNSIRQAVTKKTGIPPHCLFVHGTHTHTGATVSEIEHKLPDQAASAVQKALDNLVDEPSATLGISQERTIAFIRRFLMKDGSVRTNPGRNNPNVVRPVGEIDPHVYVLSFLRSKTMLVSFGLHPDCVGGEKFSADYPYHMTQTIKQSLGKEWNVLFLNACCGNVNHINIHDPRRQKGNEEARENGVALGLAALQAHRNATAIPIHKLAAKTQTVACPIRPVPDEIYQWAKQQMQADPDAATKRKFNERTPSLIIELAETKEKSRPAEIIAFQIGPVGLVGLPAESFVENALDIKKHSLLDPTWVIGLTGGAMGYMPHARGYSEGGYEATFGSARYAPETPTLWCETAASLLNRMAQEN